MPRVFSILFTSVLDWFRSRLSMQMELIALRHQVVVYKQSISRPKLRPTDRVLWVWLSCLWSGWREALEFVQPRTVIAWQKQRFRLGIEAVKIAPRSPWQNPYCERVIGSIRRDALDHVIVVNERHLRRVLRSYFSYYHHWRTHRSLEMDAPKPRAVQPPELGPVRKVPELGGLHHHYERLAA